MITIEDCDHKSCTFQRDSKSQRKNILDISSSSQKATGYPEKVQDKSDEELVILTLKNQDYYLGLMKRYEQKLMRYVRRLLRIRQEDCEDLVQEIFIKTYRNLNDFDPKLKFSSWIYRIAHNHVVSHIRKIKARPQLIENTDNEEILNRIVSEEDIEKQTEQKFTSKATEDVLSKMDEKYREVLVLRYLDEKDYQEISDIIKKPLGTVATLLHRAKKQFREKSEGNNILNV